nr:DivIVA domain-containing protein [Lactobacillus terrae]
MNNMNNFNPQQGPQPDPNMNNNDFFLNFEPNDILSKEFKIKMRGYDQNEVDLFLDNVIKDYESFENQIATLKNEIAMLESERNNNPQGPQRPRVNNQQQRPMQQPQPGQNPNMQARPQAPKQAAATPNKSQNSNKSMKSDSMDETYYDILRRLSNLEQRVFGHDFANNNQPKSNPTNQQPQPNNNQNVQQFSSAVVPNQYNTNNNNNRFENGHNEINSNQNFNGFNDNFNNKSNF